jgi:hypothetical protein
MTRQGIQTLVAARQRWGGSPRVVPPLAGAILRGYRWLWTATWITLLSLAALSGVFLGGWTLPLTATVMAATASTALLLALEGPHPAADRHPPTSTEPHAALDGGLKAGVAVGCVVAAAHALSGLIVPLAILAALTSPPLLHLLCTNTPPARNPRTAAQTHRPHPIATDPATSSGQVDATTLRAAVETLDDRGLCHGWRASFTCLATARSAAERTELVHLRQAYLDEMERRHPAGLRAWLESGARAASDPSRHLQVPRPPHLN